MGLHTYFPQINKHLQLNHQYPTHGSWWNPATQLYISVKLSLCSIQVIKAQNAAFSVIMTNYVTITIHIAFWLDYRNPAPNDYLKVRHRMNKHSMQEQ